MEISGHLLEVEKKLFLYTSCMYFPLELGSVDNFNLDNFEFLDYLII